MYLRNALVGALIGALAVLLLYQIPAYHPIAIGGYDAAYVQGFYEPEPAESTFLSGAVGGARWSKASSALLLPQIGLPAEISLRMRGPTLSVSPTEVAIYLNGAELLGRVTLGADWVEQSFRVESGLLKATDIFIELRADQAELPDGRVVGALLDSATYRTTGWPIMPYPAQLLYGALAGALLALLSTEDEDRKTKVRPSSFGLRLLSLGNLRLGSSVGLAMAFLLLYRLQPPFYPYPLRWLPPALVLALAAAVALRYGPALALRWPWLVKRALPGLVVSAWLGATLLAAREHLTIARPGVENDFRVFATRETLAQIFQADGFYNLGYPLLLWLTSPLAENNAFLAARLVAAVSGAALLVAGYALARRLAGPAAALFALIALALSGTVAQYGLYVGSDMPFAACFTAAVALLVWAVDEGQWTVGGGETEDDGRWTVVGRRSASGDGAKSSISDNPTVHRSPSTVCRLPSAVLLLAGFVAGCAFLVRHLGLVLLPWAVLYIFMAAGWRWGIARRAMLLFLLGFGLASAPQLIINVMQAGNPLYNQQAKNIWLAVYANADWGRWDEAPNSVTLADVLLRDPARFAANWLANMAAFFGTGAEDTSEFGRAIQLRLLGFPANWLALLGLAGWLVKLIADWRAKQAVDRPKPQLNQQSLLLLILLYALAVCMAFALPRFFLPLAPIYAAAAGAALKRLLPARPRWQLGACMALLVVLWSGFGAGTGYVLSTQPADELAAVRLVQANLAPGDLLATHLPERVPLAKYSAIAHLVVDWPGAQADGQVSADDLAVAQAAGARYLLWDTAVGPAPLPDAARIGAPGRYVLYAIDG